VLCVHKRLSVTQLVEILDACFEALGGFFVETERWFERGRRHNFDASKAGYLFCLLEVFYIDDGVCELRLSG
jgi:hypothetical protein